MTDPYVGLALGFMAGLIFGWLVARLFPGKKASQQWTRKGEVLAGALRAIPILDTETELLSMRDAALSAWENPESEPE